MVNTELEKMWKEAVVTKTGTEETHNKPVRRGCDPSEIQSRHLPNTSQKDYCLAHKIPVKVVGNYIYRAKTYLAKEIQRLNWIVKVLLQTENK
jgi:hypothetical protein